MLGIPARPAMTVGGLWVLASGVAPLAQAATTVGWVLADQPNATTSYTPKPEYSFNSAKGTISVQPLNDGVYFVVFQDLYDGAPDTVQVSVADGSSAQCVIGGWGPQNGAPTSLEITVQCYTHGGATTNAAFALLYQSRSAPFGSAANGLAYINVGRTGHVITSQPFNSTGGNNNDALNKGPEYTVTLPGMTRTGGNMQVTGFSAADSGFPTHCSVVNWAASSNGTSVNVRCYRDGNGNRYEDAFTLAYAIGDPFGLVSGTETSGAWAWANEPNNTNAYLPPLHYQYNGFKTGSLKAQRTAVGQYFVTIPGTLKYSSSTALVTAVGEGNGSCSIAGWTNATIKVSCYDQSGALADSQFNVAFQTAK